MAENKYLEVIDRMAEEDQKQRDQLARQEVNPDDAANVVNLSREYNLPEDVVERNVKAVDSLRPATMAQESGTRELQKNPQLAPVVKDDIEQLDWWEKQTRSISQSWQQGFNTVERGNIGMDLMFGGDVAAADKRLAELDEHRVDDYGFNYFEGVPMAVAENLPIMGNIIWGSKEEALVGAGLGATAGSVAPGLGTVGGGTIGLGYGFRAGNIVESFKLEAGNAFVEYRNMTDETGAAMDLDVAKGAALAVGAVNAGLESLGLNYILKAVPGADQILASMSKEGLKELMKVPTVRAALGRFGKRVSQGAMVEGVTEGLQELMTIIGGVVAADASDGEFDPEMPTAEEAGQVLSRVAAAAIKGSQGGGGIAAMGSSIQAGYDIQQVRKARTRAQAFEAMGAQANETKTLERLPKDFQEHVRKIKEKYGDVAELYVDRDALKTYLQTVPEDILKEQASETWKALQEAELAGDRPVAIPLDEFVSYFAPSENFNDLVPDIRYAPDDLNLREAEELAAELESSYQKFAPYQSDKDSTEGSDNRVYENMKAQLEKAGRSDRVADLEAQVWSAWFNTQADRMGADAWELYDKFSVSVRSTDSRGQSRGGISRAENLLDMIREGKRPEQRQIWGDSFLEAIVKKGGIRDDGGELSARDLNRVIPGMNRRVAQEGGMTLDEAMEFAVQEGFIPEYIWGEQKHDVVLDMIDRELGGDPVRRDVADQDAFDLDSDLNELEELLVRGGLDIQKLSNQEILDTLDMETLSQSLPMDKASRMQRAEMMGFDTSEVYYHGTGNLENMEAFNPDLTGQGNDQLGSGFYFTNDPTEASGYSTAITANVADGATKLGGDTSPGVSPVYLKLENPIVIEDGASLVESLDVDISQDQAFEILKRSPDIYDMENTPLWNWGDLGDGPVDDMMIEDVASNYTGASLFSITNDFFSGEDTAFRQAIHDVLGFDGVIQKFDNGKVHKVAWFPEQVRSVNAQFVPSKAESGNLLYQKVKDDATENLAGVYGMEQDAKGYIQFNEARDWFRITLTENADLSTFLHESGHFFLEGMNRLAGVEGAPETMQRDMQIIREWLENDGSTFTTEQHEKFARGFERYLMEGKTPSLQLAAAFERFKSWLMNIYKSFRGLDVELTDEVRGAMDRMFASEEAIREAKNIIEFTPLFDSAESANFTADEFRAYQRLYNKAIRDGEDALEKEMLQEVNALARREHKARRKEATARITEEVNARPEYAAATAMSKERINSDAVRAMYGKINKRMTGFVKKGGKHPEAMADRFGYGSADEMIQAVLNAPKKKELISQLVDQEVQPLDRINNGETTEKAIQALHSNPTALLLHAELKALGKQYGQNSSLAAMRQVARNRVSQMRVMDMKPAAFRTGEKRAYRKAVEAFSSGNKAAAHRYKGDQLMNHLMYSEIVKAKEEAAKSLRYLKRFETQSVRVRLGKTEYLDAIDALLEGVELKNVTNKAIYRRQSLAEFIAKQEEAEAPVIIAESLRNESELKNYKQMNLEEIRGLEDAIRNIDHLSKTKNELMVNKQRRELNEAVDEVARLMIENNKPRKGSEYQNPTKWERFKSGFMKAHGDLVKVEFLARWMDDNAQGFAHDLFFQPFVDAQSAKYDRLKVMNDKLTEIFTSRTKDQVYRHNHYHQFMGRKMKGADIIAAALNTGNASNKFKLTEGYKWDESQLMDELNTWMTKEDWNMVQSLWDAIDTLWPDIEAVHKRTSGIAPPRIEAESVQTPYGVYRGGYYPVVYDPARSYRAELNASKKDGSKLFENNFMKPNVDRGFTQSRTSVTGPLLLSLDVIPSHINEVVHFITHFEAVTNVNKVFEHGRFKMAFDETFGPEVRGKLRPWLQAVANDANVVPATDYLDHGWRHLKSGMTVVAMGFRLSTAIMQGFGLFTTVDEIGMKHTLKGVTKMLKNPVDQWNFVNENSGEMRHIINTFDRDVRQTVDSVFGKTGLWDARKQYAFYLMGYMQKTVNMVTWQGAYDQVIDERGHDDAVKYADAVVRQTQSAGGVKDLAAIQRGNHAKQIFTMFYTFFNVLYNRLTDVTRENAPAAAARLTWLVFLPVLFEGLLRNKVPEEEEEWLQWFALNSALYGVTTIPFVRDIVSGALSSYGYSVTPAGEFGKDIARATDGAYDLIVNDEEMTEAEFKAAFDALGIAAKLPTSQAWSTYQYLQKLDQGDIEDPLREFLVGADKDK